MFEKDRFNEPKPAFRYLTLLALVIIIVYIIIAMMWWANHYMKSAAAHEVHTSQTVASQWKHWGAAPYANSFSQGCRKAPWAINHSGMPEAVKRHFKKVLANGCRGGTEVWYTPGETFRQMVSGHDIHHTHDWVMNNVTIAELPITHSPNGRQYRNGSVAETAKGREWRWAYEGKTYAWTIFYVCNNEAWRIVANVVSAPVCASVTFTVRRGDTVRFAVLSQKRLPSSACWQLRDGNDLSALPAPCDICNWVGPKSVIPRGYEPLYTGRYVAHATQQTLRFPVEVKQEYLALCVTRQGLGESDSWVVRPSAWGRKNVLHVPYGGQKWPVWETKKPVWGSHTLIFGQ